ncbi:unnamed protein product, partial [Acanthocheilonema viteae]
MEKNNNCDQPLDGVGQEIWSYLIKNWSTNVTELPRLELLAILIGVRAVQFVITQLEFENVPITVWSDSKFALHWIKNHSRLLLVSIQNRMEEIRKTKASFRYIPSKDNLVDIATRGISPIRLRNCESWWKGPLWLSKKESKWPQWKYEFNEEYENEGISKSSTTMNTTKVIVDRKFRLVDANRFSTWSRLWRTTARVLKFMKIISKEKFTCLKDVSKKPLITTLDREPAMRVLITQAQLEEMTEKEIVKWKVYYHEIDHYWK